MKVEIWVFKPETIALVNKHYEYLELFDQQLYRVCEMSFLHSNPVQIVTNLW